MLPPVRSEFLDRSQRDTVDKRIEPGPGWIINTCLKAAARYAFLVESSVSEKCAEQDSAEDDQARNDDGRARPAIEKEYHEREREIELVLDRDLRCMEKS